MESIAKQQIYDFVHSSIMEATKELIIALVWLGFEPLDIQSDFFKNYMITLSDLRNQHGSLDGITLPEIDLTHVANISATAATAVERLKTSDDVNVFKIAVQFIGVANLYLCVAMTHLDKDEFFTALSVLAVIERLVGVITFLRQHGDGTNYIKSLLRNDKSKGGKARAESYAQKKEQAYAIFQSGGYSSFDSCANAIADGLGVQPRTVSGWLSKKFGSKNRK